MTAFENRRDLLTLLGKNLIAILISFSDNLRAITNFFQTPTGSASHNEAS